MELFTMPNDAVNNADVDRRLLNSTGCLFVKQRAGYLSYAVDPKVLCSFAVLQVITAGQEFSLCDMVVMALNLQPGVESGHFAFMQ